LGWELLEAARVLVKDLLKTGLRAICGQGSRGSGYDCESYSGIRAIPE